MSKLLVPKHYAQSSVAENIKSTAKHRLDSDDFVTPMNVAQQLDDLQGYLVLRRQEEPEYKLPQPSGWKLMVLMLTIPETSDGGVIVVDDAKEQRALASPQGVILAMEAQIAPGVAEQIVEIEEERRPPDGAGERVEVEMIKGQQKMTADQMKQKHDREMAEMKHRHDKELQRQRDEAEMDRAVQDDDTALEIAGMQNRNTAPTRAGGVSS